MRPEDLDYDLPADLIAQSPLPGREASRLLVLDRGGPPGVVTHARVSDLPSLLSPGDLLVLNDTRVLPARLEARRASGGWVGLLLVAPRLDGSWEALARPTRRLHPGEVLRVAGVEALRLAECLGHGLWRLEGVGGADPLEVASVHGRVPLPPYIRRSRGADPRDAEDRERYQTVYALHPGAVAAPTAGFHFTAGLLEALALRGVGTAFLTLHVGPGTFRPVSTPRLEDHRMHAEAYRVPAATREAVARTRLAGARVVAVGTTVTRTLEAVAAGAPLEGETTLFILEPFCFQAVDALVTNFHLPRSTLLALVAAFAGRERVLEAYRLAVEARYRFYSYGDAMLIR
ncbi:MAG: tRNA preQ1(34) S-adenosylmethionine ribosyltransferase-isomerase QueA [Planctomycetes bacterium]|nr:tRNA preQ1(34) S-adenosylmethionine ribosyltransferase-isomerase QueA [Planctomycetota bacterium]